MLKDVSKLKSVYFRGSDSMENAINLYWHLTCTRVETRVPVNVLCCLSLSFKNIRF